jgi:two-component system, OmpR family, phosphate regulon sensor histidine kinase PhoR
MKPAENSVTFGIPTPVFISMFFNPRVISLLLALLLALLSVVFLYFLGQNIWTLLLGFGLTFAASFLLLSLALEFLVFREIKKIYARIDKLKQKDFKVLRKQINSNINPLRQLNAEIAAYTTKKQQEIDELKKLEVYRREFLADVSHELKTPIFAAQGFIDTLIEGAMDDKEVRHKFLHKAAKSLEGLSMLVQDLLTVSQMESGDIQMKLQTCDLYEITQEVFEELEEKAVRRNTSVGFEKKNEYPAIVRADPARIRQVMMNLIDNAIKYGNEGGKVRVGFTAEKEGLVVSVRDDGPGIEPEHLKRIFERFYRIEKSRSKDKGGTGLGLAIVKHIVEAHKSKVQVNSKVGKGATFSFRLEKN